MSPVPLRGLNWRLIATAIMVVTVSTLPAFLTASAIAQAGPELGYGTQGLGLLTALFFLVASASSSVIGGTVERVGWQTTMRLNAGAAAVVLLTIALTVQTVTGLTAALAVAAAVYGAANPAANLALARAVPSSRRGLVFGLKHAGIPTSTLLAGLAVPAVVLTLGWRWAFGLGAGLACAVLFLIPAEGRTLPVSPAATHPPRRMEPKWLALLSMASAFATVGATALSTFQVDAALELGFGEAAAGTLLAVGSLGSIAARSAYGHLADRTGTAGFGFIAVLTGLGAGTFLLMGVSTGALFAGITVLAFVTGWGWPGLLTYSVVRANEGRPAGSTAITQAGIFAGAGLGPFGIGWLAENVSFRVAWVAVAASLSVACALMLVVRTRGVQPDNPGIRPAAL